ncbi:hypothetical protein LCGC14_3142560, partial [marine sediment metagenome]
MADTLSIRFWNKVDRQSSSVCWNWLAAKSVGGYGMIRVSNIWRQATHVVWYLLYGQWPKQINHHCDNSSCVNPKHLYKGTQKENMTDAVDRGRCKPLFVKGHSYGIGTRFKNGHDSPIGENHPQAKLTERNVAIIRKKYNDGGITQKELANEFGVSQSVVNGITTGKRWRHV